MAASKRETILEYLKATLLPGVTVANGYNYTLGTIRRGIKSIREMSDGDFPAVFIAGVTEKRNRITVNQFKSELQVNLVGYVNNASAEATDDATQIQRCLDLLIQDLTKVIEADPLQKVSGSPLVYSTEITSIETDDGDLMPTAGCMISVNFKYAAEGANP